jgi:hypothetical protein
MTRTLLALSVFAGTLFGQGHVEPENLYPRILCVVPMIGTGAPGDPRRPMFTPVPSALAVHAPAANAAAVPAAPGDTTSPTSGTVSARPPIFAFQYQLSDDGNYALLELVGVNKAAFANIIGAAVPGVAVFDRTTATDSQIETAFKQHKSNFSMKTFVPVRVN